MIELPMFQAQEDRPAQDRPAQPDEKGAGTPPAWTGLLAPSGEAEEGPSLADLFAPPKKPAADPAAPPAGGAANGVEDPEMRARVARVIDELRPFINADGGDITLVSVIDGVVKVTMHGACVGCSSSLYTLQLGIERKLREEIPGIKYIEAV